MKNSSDMVIYMCVGLFSFRNYLRITEKVSIKKGSLCIHDEYKIFLKKFGSAQENSSKTQIAENRPEYLIGALKFKIQNYETSSQLLFFDKLQRVFV